MTISNFLHLPSVTSTPQLTAPSFANLEEFQAKIFQEFVQESAIDPILFQTAIQIHSDLETSITGDIETPIHSALNWNYTRFGKQANKTFYAAIFYNEDGTCWQAKLSQPLFDQTKQKVRKYEAPKQGGSRAFLPPIPTQIRRQISDRYRVFVPLEGSFWEWLERHPEIPIIFTEGGKKALALLSLGYVAIALYGVNGGYRKQFGDERTLIADIASFVQENRQIHLAFDQDLKETTQQNVKRALSRFGFLLTEQKGEVSIVTWDGAQGKGVDDLIVNQGSAAWEKCYVEALSLKHWQIWQRIEGQLTYPSSLRLNTHDLSTLSLTDLPTTGILAISSDKGTGKSKFVGQQVAHQPIVLVAGHRVCLMRNLCSRLKIDYRGDLDKAEGRFINGSAYSLRVGFCVDSLLAISPEQFSGCILILDEVVQVLRHLLTSSTCAKDGKRPALLARFRLLIQSAQQVIIADADLNNASIRYIQDLRGEDNSVFLIRNDYKLEGYHARLINCPDRSTIITELLDELQKTAPGKTVFIATDSKNISKTIARLIQQQFPHKTALLINSETSGGESEREFMQFPDWVVERKTYDVIICSPSVSTGLSIETKGVISKVYGIFSGGSSTDADITQALSRVREPVERVVWCVRYGANFSKVSRSTSALEIKHHLRQKTNASISLVRSNLREDAIAGLSNYDWNNDPHINLYAHISAEQNFAMRNLLDTVLIRLKIEGHNVVVETHQSDPTMKALFAQTTRETREMEAEALVAAPDLSLADVLLLETKETITPEEHLALKKYYIKDFYCLDVLTVEDVLWDVKGRRKQLLNLEAQLFPQLALDRTAKTLEQQGKWNVGACPWDVSHAELRRQLRQDLGLEELIQKGTQGWRWSTFDLAPYVAKAKEMAPLIKIILNFTISPKMADAQIIHQLLSQLGVSTDFNWSRAIPEAPGQKLKLYYLKMDVWDQFFKVVEARQARREQYQSNADRPEVAPLPGSTPDLIDQTPQGDLKSTDPQTSQNQGFTAIAPSLTIIQKMWSLASTPAEKQWITENIPSDLLEKAIS